MEFQKKYFKYKKKYIELKKQEGGMKFLRKMSIMRRPVQGNLLKPIVTNFIVKIIKLLLPKGSRLYHLSPHINLELMNKPTYFGASPIGSVIMAPIDGDGGDLSEHSLKIKRYNLYSYT